VDPDLLLTGAQWWQQQCDLLVVEGAGGALSPLSSHSTVLDLAVQLKYPVILIAEHRLGMMNHVLLTREAIERRGLECLALIINEVRPPAERHNDWPVLGESLAGLAPFCANLPCWISLYAGSTLSPAATYDTMSHWKS
jgi:dethiobiotin synthetase